MSKSPQTEIGRKVRRAKRRAQGESTEVAGPADSPATNLLLADIAMRMGSKIMRSGIERAFLRGRYGKDTAKAIVANRSLKRTLASTVVAKIGARSLPGAVLVTSGLVVKALFDRSRDRQEAKRTGDAALIDRATEE